MGQKIDFKTGKKRLANRSKRLRRYKGPKGKKLPFPFMDGFGLGFALGVFIGHASSIGIDRDKE